MQDVMQESETAGGHGRDEVSAKLPRSGRAPSLVLPVAEQQVDLRRLPDDVVVDAEQLVLRLLAVELLELLLRLPGAGEGDEARRGAPCDESAAGHMWERRERTDDEAVPVQQLQRPRAQVRPAVRWDDAIEREVCVLPPSRAREHRRRVVLGRPPRHAGTTLREQRLKAQFAAFRYEGVHNWQGTQCESCERRDVTHCSRRIPAARTRRARIAPRGPTRPQSTSHGRSCI